MLAGALALALLLPGAAPAAELPPPATPGTTIPAGQIDQALAALDAIARGIMQRSGVPGMAVVVVRDGRTVFARGYGVRKVGAPEPVDADTVFPLASLSKPVSATVVAAEVAAGRIGWDTPVIDHLPGFALADPYVTAHVTIGDFFAHRSGLPDHAGDQLEDLGFDAATILERLRLLPLAPFRAHYAYTNFGLTAAALSVAAAAGTDWATLAESRLFAPLGMTATSYRFADLAARPNRAVGHVPVAGRMEPGPVRQPDAQAPAGGLSASARDFGRWLALVLGTGRLDGQEILPAAALLPALRAQMVTSAPPDPAFRPDLYGFGFNVGSDASGRVVLSHSGAFALGAGTAFSLLPLDQLGIAVFTNAAPTGTAEAITRTFLDIVEFGAPQRDWYAAYAPLFAALMAPEGALVGQPHPANPAPPPATDRLVGRYDSAYFGPVTIGKTSDGLVLTLGPDGTAYPLTPWDGAVFTIRPDGENAPAGSISRVTATLPGTGTGPATALTIEFLDADGLGTFTR